MQDNNTLENKHYWLYVLKLEQGKYYVGITAKTPELRLRQHMSGFLAAKWTKKYKPVSIYVSKDLGIVTEKTAEYFENKVVREYIKKYGLKNVRGGDLSYSGTLLRRFGWYWHKDDWKAIMGLVFLVLIILYLTFRVYLNN